MAVPKQRIYLDYNASSPIHPKVADAVGVALNTHGNASSVHADGRAMKSVIEKAREAIAGAVGVSSQTITFASGGTEANYGVITGLKASLVELNVLGSSIEHPSVLAHIPVVNRVRVKDDGLVDLDDLRKVLTDQTTPFVFCLMLANNETGVVQPVAEVSSLVHDFGGLVLCDAVQGLGKLPLDLPAIGADFYAFSGHKIGAPQGTGCVINPGMYEIGPWLPGGGQERGKRSGTENVPGIVGFGAAAELVADQSDAYFDGSMRDRFEAELLAARPDAVIVGQQASRIPNTTNISIPGLRSDRQVIKLDLSGFSVSAGSACSSGKVEPSHVLIGMGLPQEITESAIRISFGPSTEWDDLERFVEEWSKL